MTDDDHSDEILINFGYKWGEVYEANKLLTHEPNLKSN